MQYFLKIKIFALLIAACSLCFLLIYIALEINLSRMPTKVSNLTSVNIPYVVVHLDLKTTPLSLMYMEYFFIKIKEMGANAVLIEYEDMFPFEGRLVNISAKNCYQKDALKKILTEANNRGLKLIPLVQTFGHLEYALKLPEFQYLREHMTFPDSICPSRNKSLVLIKLLLEQIIKFHQSIAPLEYIHIGFDEVYHLGLCRRCIQRNTTKLDIFLSHLVTIKNILQTIPGLKILIWDDMIRQIPPLALRQMNSFIFEGIEPVYWDYGSNPNRRPSVFYYYNFLFSNTWIATAFKGADGEAAMLPNMINRFTNNFHWMELITNYVFAGEKEVHTFGGVILTGWSRYSHMEPPCELMPVSYPSLALNLLLIQKYKAGVIIKLQWKEFYTRYLENDFNREMGCSKNEDLENFYNWTCKFHGSDLFQNIKEYMSVTENIMRDIDAYDKNLFSIEYYSQLNLVNKNKIWDNYERCNNYLSKIKELERHFVQNVSIIYDVDFANEYVLSKTYAVKKRLYNIISSLNNATKSMIWPRGPSGADTNFQII